MIKTLIMVLLIFFSQSSLAKIIATGKLCGTRISSGSNLDASNNPGKYSFPLKAYEAEIFFICDLKYHPSTPQSERKLDLTIYKTIAARGSLDLTKYNKENNYYQYHLFMRPSTISNNTLELYSKIKKINGHIMPSNTKRYFSIEGYFDFNHNKLALRNIIKEDSCYKMTPDKHFPRITLTRLQDLPVLVEFEIDEKDNK